MPDSGASPVLPAARCRADPQLSPLEVRQYCPTRGPNPVVVTHRNGFIERMNRALLDQRFRVQGRTPSAGRES